MQLPKGVINVISGGAEVGRVLTSHKDIGKILFTGGTATASHVIKNSAEKNIFILQVKSLIYLNLI